MNRFGGSDKYLIMNIIQVFMYTMIALMLTVMLFKTILELKKRPCSYENKDGFLKVEARSSNLYISHFICNQKTMPKIVSCKFIYNFLKGGLKIGILLLFHMHYWRKKMIYLKGKY